MEVDFRKTEVLNCTFVKTTLMLIIVLYHSILFWTGTWFSSTPIYEAKIFAALAIWMNSFHIYSFTLVSGYLFYYLKYENGKYAQYIPFLKRKAKRLLVPYAFIAIVWVIPISYAFFKYDFTEIFHKYILGTAPSQLWFLLMLFGVFAIFYPISNYIRNHHLLGAVVIIGFYGIGLVGQLVLPNLFQIFRACMYMPVFWVGFKLCQYGTAWARRIPAWLWVLVQILVFVSAQYFAGFEGIIFTLVRMGINFVANIVGALMAFVVLQKLADKVNWKENKLFGFMSRMSMPVYLLHQQIIYVCIYFLNGLLNPYIHAGVNFLVAIVLSLGCAAVLMKYPITRFLIGEK